MKPFLHEAKNPHTTPARDRPGLGPVPFQWQREVARKWLTMTLEVFNNLHQKTEISTKQFTHLHLEPILSWPKSRLSTAPHRGSWHGPGSYHQPTRHFCSYLTRPCPFRQSIYIVLRCKHSTQLKSYSLIGLVVVFMGTFKHESSVFHLVFPLNVVPEGCLPASVQFPHIKEYCINITHTHFQL